MIDESDASWKGWPELAITAAAVGGTITVSQVQDDLFGWPLFSTAPYYLGCYQASDSAVSPFTNCRTTEDEVTGTPKLLTTGSSTQALTAVARATTSATYFAIFRGPQLLPEQVPKHLIVTKGAGRAQTWLLLCASGATQAICTTNSDASVPPALPKDTSPNLGDCNDANSSVFWPQESETSGTVDKNCDGWAKNFPL